MIITSKGHFRKYAALLVIPVVLALFSYCSKYKTVMENTSLIENPGEKKAVAVDNGQVSRGEFVKMIEEKQFDGKKFFKVQLEGVDTKGWLDAKFVQEGKLEMATIIADAEIFARPTLKSAKAGMLKAGQAVFKLKESEGFYQVNYSGKEGFVQKDKLGKASDVIRTISIPGIGVARVRSSSYLVPSSGNELKYDPRNLFDGSIQTSWVEGKSNDDGISEWVSIEFENIITLYEVGVINGFASDENTYKSNNRVAGLRIESSSGGSMDMELTDDNYDYQNTPVNIAGQSFKFIITKVHKGKVSDTCISEIRIKGNVGAEYGHGGE
jgi:hypothetical protein